jgi:outer membrane biosynthesis protein TonB
MSPSRIDKRSRLSAATFAGGRRGPAGLIVSLLMHGAIVAALFITFSHKLEIVQEQSPIVPVDVVTIADKTNVRAAVKVHPKAKPVEEKPVEAPQPKPQPQPPPPPEPAKAEPMFQHIQKVEEPPPPPPEPDLMKPEPLPETPPPDIQLEKPKPEAEVQPEKAPETKPKKEAQAKPKKEKFDIDNVLALLDKRAPSASSAPNARTADRDIKGIGAQTAMTAELQDAMLSQIRQCWSPPVGAPHAEDLVVDFELVLNQDGSVASAASDALSSSNSYTKAAAGAAKRAIYECAPYKLPADRFKEWHDIMLTFDPRQMMGQQ